MRTRTFRLNKLVRDKLVKINFEMGGEVDFKVLSGENLNKELLKKLVEEAKELENEPALSAGEIADLQEILDQLIKNYGLTKADIKAKQAKKRTANGGFSKGHFIKTLTLPADNQWAEYYSGDPERFKEIK